MKPGNDKKKRLSPFQQRMIAAKKEQRNAQLFYDKVIKPRLKDKKVHPNIVVVNDGDNDEDDFL